MKRTLIFLSCLLVAAQDVSNEPQVKLTRIQAGRKTIKIRGATNLPDEIELRVQLIPVGLKLEFGGRNRIITEDGSVAGETGAPVKKRGFRATLDIPETWHEFRIQVHFNPLIQRTAAAFKSASSFAEMKYRTPLVLTDPDDAVRALNRERKDMIKRIDGLENLLRRIKAVFQAGAWDRSWKPYMDERTVMLKDIERELPGTAYRATMTGLREALVRMARLAPAPKKMNIPKNSQQGAKLTRVNKDPWALGDSWLLEALELYIVVMRRSIPRERIVSPLHIARVHWNHAMELGPRTEDGKEARTRFIAAAEACERNGDLILHDRPNDEEDYSEADELAEDWLDAVRETLGDLRGIMDDLGADDERIQKGIDKLNQVDLTLRRVGK